jgi:hypothetical protein
MTLRVAVLIALVAGATTQEPQRPIFQAKTDLVLVNVSVMRGNEPVGGLAASDFLLSDNGVRQDVELVSAGGFPTDVTVIFSAVPGSQVGALEASVLSADQMRALLTPGDRLRVISAGGPIRELLAMAATSKPPRAGGLAKTRGIATNDALFYALAWPIEPGRRHLVVAFTNGMDTWSALDASILPTLASRSDAVVHAVMFATPPPYPKSSRASEPSGHSTILGGLAPASAAPSQSETVEQIAAWRRSFHAVEEVTRRTGGSVQYNVGASVESFKAALDDLRASYLLRYTPRNVTVAGWHDIVVKVPGRGSVSVRARQGYEGG